MAYKVIILYRLYMPSYVLGTFTEYPLNILSFLIPLPLQSQYIHPRHFQISFSCPM